MKATDTCVYDVTKALVSKTDLDYNQAKTIAEATVDCVYDQLEPATPILAYSALGIWDLDALDLVAINHDLSQKLEHKLPAVTPLHGMEGPNLVGRVWSRFPGILDGLYKTDLRNFFDQGSLDLLLDKMSLVGIALHAAYQLNPELQASK